MKINKNNLKMKTIFQKKNKNKLRINNNNLKINKNNLKINKNNFKMNKLIFLK